MQQRLNEDLPNLGRGRSFAIKAGQKNWLDRGASSGLEASDAKTAAAQFDASGYHDLSRFGYMGVGRRNRRFALNMHMKALTCMSATMISHDFMRFSCCKFWSTAWKSGFAFGAAPDLRVTETACFGDERGSVAAELFGSAGTGGLSSTLVTSGKAGPAAQLVPATDCGDISFDDWSDSANTSILRSATVSADFEGNSTSHATCLRDALLLLGKPVHDDEAFMRDLRCCNLDVECRLDSFMPAKTISASR